MRISRHNNAKGMTTNDTTCPSCHSGERQVKAGTYNGKQRYKCLQCEHRYTPNPDPRGKSEDIKGRARHLAQEGHRMSSIARQLGVSSQSVSNWLKEAGIERPVPTSVGDNDAAARTRNGSSPSLPKRKPTISDVAERAGVSVASISNYLNGKGRLKDSTREQIQSAIADLHFAPSALMRGILNRRTHILGVMIFDLNTLGVNVGTAVAPQLLAGMSAAAYESGHHILLYTGFKYEDEASAASEFLNGTIDGMVWVAREAPEPMLDSLAAAGLPTIAVLDRRAPDGIGYVDGDDIAGMELLVRHLVDRGHKRIAYVGSRHSSNFQDRAEGYRLGLEVAGLPYDSHLEATGNQFRRSREEYVAAVERWLSMPEPPTAIMVQNDRWANQVIEILHDCGRRVPEDIAVTGFDDAPDAAWIGGGLTTVRQKFDDMGRQAVVSVIELIEGAPLDQCRQIMPVELVVRATTGG